MDNIIKFDIHKLAKEIADGTKALGCPISSPEALSIAKETLEGKTSPVTLLKSILDASEASESVKEPILSRWASFLEVKEPGDE